MASMTLDTYGLIVYQEQMLRIVREIGLLSWEDTTALRKGMSKSLGLEYFENYWLRFKDGANENGIDELLARQIWETVNSAGGYCFNMSHAVAYGMVAYWCAVLKARFPLQFALATLRHTDDSINIKQYLRELDHAGYSFKVYDADASEIDWSVKGDSLLGGLTNIKGIGAKSASDIIARRKTGEPPTDHQIDLLTNGKTEFDNVFEIRTNFAEILVDPPRFGIVSKLSQIADVGTTEETYTIIGKLLTYRIRSLNELQFLLKRNHMKVADDKWLTMLIEDDTGTIPATISRFDYVRIGQPLVASFKHGSFFVFRGKTLHGIRRLFLNKWLPLKTRSL